MKPLIITAALALCAPLASAGDFSFDFGFGKSRHGKSIRVGVGYKDKDRHVRRHRPHRGHRHHRAHRPRGHYEYVKQRVWVPGHYERVYHPAEYGWRRDRCGRRVRVIVHHAHYDRVWHPGHWEYRTVKVWRPHGRRHVHRHR